MIYLEICHLGFSLWTFPPSLQVCVSLCLNYPDGHLTTCLTNLLPSSKDNRLVLHLLSLPPAQGAGECTAPSPLIRIFRQAPAGAATESYCWAFGIKGITAGDGRHKAPDIGILSLLVYLCTHTVFILAKSLFLEVIWQRGIIQYLQQYIIISNEF